MILAGGAGTRLWPIARPSEPKPFMDLLGGASLLRRTLDRVTPLVGHRILVVCGKKDIRRVRREARSLPMDRVIAEAVGRNTAASVALAALRAWSERPDEVLAILPSDHWITGTEVFRRALRRAVVRASRPGALVTFGVPPAGPDPGYGYIGPCVRGPVPGFERARGFVEKPSAARAARLLRTDRYYWNSGIFVWRADTILAALRRHCPDVLAPLEEWAGSRRRGSWRVPATVLRRVDSVPIDRAVLERVRDIDVMRAPFRWSDVGGWGSFGDVLPKDSHGNGALGRLLAIDTHDCLAINPGGRTAFVGVRGLVAVRSGDNLLVCARDAVQRVRDVAARWPGRVRGNGRRRRS